ncbi:cell division cycle protein 123 homolog [Anneissia japonica]|uniref:cell division cycle protein 123 homolog n=1 Tax=Anneissia japonica TaxID=1529436 RepID=UPI001425815C|nr:cell division cycle protein 123 homolog [Anneissia japonica]
MDTCLGPELNVSDVFSCSFSSWYSSFENLTISSKVLVLPPEVKSYLLADGIVLPEEDNYRSTADTSEDEEDDWDDGNQESQPPKFVEFEATVKQAIEALGGSVFPKLNWSAPRDASWIAFGNTLKCEGLNEILLLLKSSDFITHDLTRPFDCCHDSGTHSSDSVQYELVLREWCSLAQSMEFRVFVKQGVIVGISQRDFTNYFPELKNIAARLPREIQRFHSRHIAGKFTLQNYVFDVYRRATNNYLLIDFNPFGEVCDSLLFSWEELRTRQVDGTQEDIFRYVMQQEGVKPNPYGQYRVPTDVIDIATGSDPQKLVDFLKVEAERQAREDSTKDDTDDVER